VLFGFLLDVTNLLRQLLESVFISAVLHLEVWPGGRSQQLAQQYSSSASYLVASCRLALLEMPWLLCEIQERSPSVGFSQRPDVVVWSRNVRSLNLPRCGLPLFSLPSGPAGATVFDGPIH
jgi:hypothetical protein